MTMNSRRNFLQTIGFGTAAAAVAAGSGPALAQARVSLRAAHMADETSMMYRLSVEPLLRHLETLTDGQVSMRFFPGGVIAPALQTHQAVEDGLVDAAIVTPLWVVNRDPANSYFGGHPGGMSAEALLAWYNVGGGAELLAEHRRATMGLHSLLIGMNPTEIWHSHRPIRTRDDLRGLRFRTAGAWATILNEYFEGAATTVPATELFTMLERGGVDAAEWSTPSENLNMGLEAAAPYVILPGVHAPAATVELVFRASVWDGLDPAIRARIEIAARATVLECLQRWELADLAAMQAIRDSSIEIVEMDPSLVEAIREAGRDWAEAQAAERLAAGDDWMQRVSRSYSDFQDNWRANGIYRSQD